MIFTGVNVGLYWILTTVLNYEISLSIVLVLLFDAVGTILIIAPLIKLIDLLINKIRRTSGQSYAENKATRDYIFNSDKYQAVYIFDFDNNLITCGWLDYQQAADNNYFDLALMPFSDTMNVTYENVSKKIMSDNTNSRIIVDFEKKIKIFVERITLD